MNDRGGSILFGGVAAVFRWFRNRLHERDPLSVTVTRLLQEPWAVAFPGELRVEDRGELERAELARAERVPREPGHHELYKMLRDRGAVDHHKTELRLTLRNRTEHTIVIHNVFPVVARRPPNLTGTYLGFPSEGVNQATLLVFDLDERTPVAWLFEDRLGSRVRIDATPFFSSHNITLASDDPTDIIIVCETDTAHCHWRLYIEVDVRGRTRRKTIEDNGWAYETTGGDPYTFITGLYWQWGNPGESVFHELEPPP